MSEKQETFTISELAAQLDVSPSTIRFYEDKGLISPSRTPGNQRVYTHRDRGRLKLILRGKRFGASLDEIAEMVGYANTKVNELNQIERSLYYLELKQKDIQLYRRELDLFEEDLLSLREKLLGRKQELSGNTE